MTESEVEMKSVFLDKTRKGDTYYAAVHGWNQDQPANRSRPLAELPGRMTVGELMEILKLVEPDCPVLLRGAVGPFYLDSCTVTDSVYLNCNSLSRWSAVL
jgi:hypothetical protein